MPLEDTSLAQDEDEDDVEEEEEEEEDGEEEGGGGDRRRLVGAATPAFVSLAQGAESKVERGEKEVGSLPAPLGEALHTAAVAEMRRAGATALHVSGEPIPRSMFGRDGPRLASVLAPGEAGDAASWPRVLAAAWGTMVGASELGRLGLGLGGLRLPLTSSALAWRLGETTMMLAADRDVVCERHPRAESLFFLKDEDLSAHVRLHPDTESPTGVRFDDARVRDRLRPLLKPIGLACLVGSRRTGEYSLAAAAAAARREAREATAALERQATRRRRRKHQKQTLLSKPSATIAASKPTPSPSHPLNIPAVLRALGSSIAGVASSRQRSMRMSATVPTKSPSHPPRPPSEKSNPPEEEEEEDAAKFFDPGSGTEGDTPHKREDAKFFEGESPQTKDDGKFFDGAGEEDTTPPQNKDDEDATKFFDSAESSQNPALFDGGAKSSQNPALFNGGGAKSSQNPVLFGGGAKSSQSKSSLFLGRRRRQRRGSASKRSNPSPTTAIGSDQLPKAVTPGMERGSRLRSASMDRNNSSKTRTSPSFGRLLSEPPSPSSGVSKRKTHSATASQKNVSRRPSHGGEDDRTILPSATVEGRRAVAAADAKLLRMGVPEEGSDYGDSDGSSGAEIGSVGSAQSEPDTKVQLLRTNTTVTDTSISLERLARAARLVPARPWMRQLSAEIGFNAADGKLFAHKRHIHTLITGRRVIASAPTTAPTPMRMESSHSLDESQHVPAIDRVSSSSSSSSPSSSSSSSPSFSANVSQSHPKPLPKSSPPDKKSPSSSPPALQKDDDDDDNSSVSTATTVPASPPHTPERRQSPPPTSNLPPTPARTGHARTGLEVRRVAPWVRPVTTVTVVRDRRKTRQQRLHVMTAGSPEKVLARCLEFWDGESILELSKSRRAAILDTVRQWRAEGQHCVAFGYDPLSNQDAGVFRALDLAIEGNAKPKIGIATDPDAIFLLEGPAPAGITPEVKDDYSLSLERRLRRMQNGHIFLGLLAARHVPRREVSDMNRRLHEDGVRFIYASPRSYRGARSLAERMGVATGWNTAVSLRSRSKRRRTTHQGTVNSIGAGVSGSSGGAGSARPNVPEMEEDDDDFEGTILRGDAPKVLGASGSVVTTEGWRKLLAARAEDNQTWDENAQLPHGLDEIRHHLAEVDNVPLLVSLFTETTPPTLGGLLRIMQEYGEVLLVAASAMRRPSPRLVEIADVGLAVLPPEPRPLSAMQRDPDDDDEAGFVVDSIDAEDDHGQGKNPLLALATSINTLHAGIVLPARAGLDVVPVAIAEARNTLTHARAAIAVLLWAPLAVGLLITLGLLVGQGAPLPPALGVWIAWIVAPLCAVGVLFLPDTPRTTESAPPKRANPDDNDLLDDLLTVAEADELAREIDPSAKPASETMVRPTILCGLATHLATHITQLAPATLSANPLPTSTLLDPSTVALPETHRAQSKPLQTFFRRRWPVRLLSSLAASLALLFAIAAFAPFLVSALLLPSTTHQEGIHALTLVLLTILLLLSASFAAPRGTNPCVARFPCSSVAFSVLALLLLLASIIIAIAWVGGIGSFQQQSIDPASYATAAAAIILLTPALLAAKYSDDRIAQKQEDTRRMLFDTRLGMHSPI